jgi:hypothetical protein
VREEEEEDDDDDDDDNEVVMVGVGSVCRTDWDRIATLVACGEFVLRSFWWPIWRDVGIKPVTR